MRAVPAQGGMLATRGQAATVQDYRSNQIVDAEADAHQGDSGTDIAGEIQHAGDEGPFEVRRQGEFPLQGEPQRTQRKGDAGHTHARQETSQRVFEQRSLGEEAEAPRRQSMLTPTPTADPHRDESARAEEWLPPHGWDFFTHDTFTSSCGRGPASFGVLQQVDQLVRIGRAVVVRVQDLGLEGLAASATISGVIV